MTSDSAEAATLDMLTSRLHADFPAIPISTVERIVTDVYADYDACRIREFIPLLVERESREQLRAPTRRGVNSDSYVEGPVTVRPPVSRGSLEPDARR